MSRPNDIGGRLDFGPISPEPQASERVFHADWEKRLFGLTQTTRGNWTIDMFRGARERDEQSAYLARGYFENWLVGFERVLAGSGLVTAEELVSGKAVSGPSAAPGAAQVGPGHPMMPAPPAGKPGRFKLRDRVRVVASEPRGHTRKPAYTHGHVGAIVEDHGIQRFPDRSSEGVIEGQQLYTVSFEARELWGDRAEGLGAVLVDLWDEYLEPLP